jgi:RecB family exonuclease
MAEPTRDDIDALVGPATPHFAYQLRARVRELVQDLPDEHPVRRYGEEKMDLLDRLGHASSLATSGEREPASRIGWETIPSSAPAYDPLPRAPLDASGSRPAEPGSTGG